MLLRLQFSSAFCVLNSSMSMPVMCEAPLIDAAMPRMKVPHPISSTFLPLKSLFSMMLVNTFSENNWAVLELVRR